MRRLQYYILRRTAVSFLAVLVTLTAIVWVTQALRRFDLVTAKGQAILVYLGMTMLALPSLVAIVAPFALVIAMAMTLNAMHADSELVASNAAGASHRQILTPFLTLGVAVSLAVGWISLESGPGALQALRNMTNRVSADIVANVVQPGRFVDIDDDFTFHIRDRAGDGTLQGLFIYDARDEAMIFTYSAERGRLTEVAGRPLVIMENGTVERWRREDQTSTFVAFGSYGFDLSELTGEPEGANYRPNELTFVQLLSLEPDDPMRAGREAQFASEIRTRLASFLYPVIMVLALFLFFGFAKSTRTQRAAALMSGLALAALVRLTGFALQGISSNAPELLVLVNAVPAVLLIVFGACVALGIQPFAPAFLVNAFDRIGRLAGKLRRTERA